MAKLEPVELEVERMGRAGEGVAVLPDGRVAFVAGALPGELVRARVREVHRSYVKASTEAVIRPADARRLPPCPVYDACGGCAFQHWDYRAEAAYKERRVVEALARIGHIEDPPVLPILSARSPYGYRNKGQFPWGLDSAGMPVAGLYARGTHRVVPVESCLIQDPLVNRVVAEAVRLARAANLTVYDERSRQGLLRHLLVRSSRSEHAALAALVVSKWDPRLPELGQRLLDAGRPELRGVVANLNSHPGNRVLGDETRLLAGSMHLGEKILDFRFRMSATAFFQVNPGEVERLYAAAIDAIPPHTENAWDLYAGVGTLSILASRRAARVQGWEANPAAVADAAVNIALNGLHGRVEVRAQRVETAVARADGWPSVVVVDPPRAGLEAQTIDRLIARRISRVIYVSCNPDTLARDLERFGPGYALRSVQPVDMFPRTDHVESVAVLDQA